MLAGADSIDDLDVLRHGGMAKVFSGIRAPSTFDSFLRVHLRPRPLLRTLPAALISLPAWWERRDAEGFRSSETAALHVGHQEEVAR